MTRCIVFCSTPFIIKGIKPNFENGYMLLNQLKYVNADFEIGQVCNGPSVKQAELTLKLHHFARIHISHSPNLHQCQSITPQQAMLYFIATFTLILYQKSRKVPLNHLISDFGCGKVTKPKKSEI